MVTSASGWGVASIAGSTILDVFFPHPVVGGSAPAEPDSELSALAGKDSVRGVENRVILVDIVDLDQPPTSAEDAYLRLHLLSHRLVRPHGLNLDGIFGLLTNVAWTSLGPCLPADLPQIRLRAKSLGLHLAVTSVDKFPRMTDYVVPSGVRIADADRVRLGAYLAEGTTVMHEGFVNFNAGTLGHAMVEGRISAGVVIGNGTDIGGGASIMGTLSGGGSEVISLGENCLLGANSGIGISLGDNCVVAAGCYVTAGTKVSLEDGSIVKARELSGQSDWQLWTNSETGRVEARRRTSTVELNQDLHSSQ